MGFLHELKGKVVDDHIVEEENNHEDIRIRWFDFNLLDKEKEGVGRKGLIKYPHLLMLMQIWPRDIKNQL